MRQQMRDPSKLGGKQDKCSVKRPRKRELATASTDAEKPSKMRTEK